MNKSLMLAVVFVLFAVCSLVYFAPANAQERTSEKAQFARETVGTSMPVGSRLLYDMEQLPVKSGKNFPKVIVGPNVASDGDAQGILISGIRSSDTDGEEGETQFVKVEGTGFQIFDKATGNPILGPSDISTIWAGSGEACETAGTGNAVVLYDKDAGRWIFSQFASRTGDGLASEECFAISATGDATGSYYRYAFHLGGRFVDSPHLSVRSDGYVMGDSVYDESSLQRIGNQFFIFDRTAMLDGFEANFKSPGIDTGTGETYSISAEGVRITSGPTRAAVSTLTINLTFDPDATFTAAGLTAQNILDMKAASAFAATQLTSNFKDPVNVNIKVTSVADPTVLGESQSSLISPGSSFLTIRNKTFADKTTADDITATGATGSLASTLTDPIGGSSKYWVTTAQGKALAITADDAVTIDGTYTFGGGHSYTYDSNNRAVAGKTDYIGVTLHEFTEIMGRIGLLGATIGGGPGYMQMDLFHYTGANTRGMTSGAGRSFSFNNGTTLLKAFNFPNGNGSDAQDWASGTNDAFNAFSSSGVKNDMSAVDLQVMDVIGYDFGASAPASTMTANVGTTPQSAAISAAFANPLAVTVRDGSLAPIAGVNVTFTAPGAGASGTFSNATATITVATNAAGVAAAPFTANSTIGGPYTVTAAASGFTTLNFLLTNTAGAATSMTANAGTTPQSAAINLAFANAPAVTVRDVGNNPVSGVNVTFTAPGAGASGKFSNNTATITVATNASGIASASFTANTTVGGPYTVTAAASGLTTVNFLLTNITGAATSMNTNAGTTPQSATINSAFTNSLAVTVRDLGNNPVSGVNVTFTSPASGASGTFSNATTTITVATNASGIASAPFTANATAGGPYNVTAASSGLTTVNFALTNTAGAAASMATNAGTTPQSAAINTAFTNPLAVTIRDISLNPVAGVNVTFTAPGAGASGTFSNGTATITVATNASGIASAPFTSNATTGGPYNVTAASSGLTTVNFALTNTAGAAASMTTNAGTTPQSATINTSFANSLAVTVRDAGNNPVSGVNVTFTAPGAGASGTFSNATATITVATNASGVASAPFTANATAAGPYNVTAAASGLTTVNFSLTNTVGAATSMTANVGTTPQNTAINAAFANPLAVTIRDVGSNPVSGVNVTFTAPGAGASGKFSNATTTITVATNAAGVASAPFTANATSGGPYNVTAAAGGLTTVNFSLTNSAGVATSMTANAGTTPQSATINTAFANPLAVTVRDAGNNPVSGVNVAFTAPGAGASGTFSNATTTITISTNASGIASAPFTANATAGGPYNVTAASSGLTTVNFSVTNTVGAATSMTANVGTTPQSAVINAVFAVAPAVTIRDAGANPISGTNVTFTAPGAGASGKFSNATTAITVATNASGVASAPFTANGTAGGPYIVTAAAGGLTTVNFSLTNSAGATPTPTPTPLPCPTTFTVNTNADAGDAIPGDTFCSTAGAVCTLRAAIQEANALPSCGTIAINLGGVTSPIGLTTVLPAIDHNVDINGPGASSLTVQRNSGSNFRIFLINTGRTVNISDLTITGGNSDFGAGIATNGTLNLTSSVVTANVSTGGGGGLGLTSGTLTVTDSTVSGNTASISGGGIETTGGTLNVVRSTVSGNSAGGGFSGGGIDSSSILTITNSTISGNSITSGVGSGGGIWINGATTITGSTITNNSVPAGGGAGGVVQGSPFTTTVRDTIIAGNVNNSTNPDVDGAFLSSGYNLIGNKGTATGFTGTADQVGPVSGTPIDPLISSLTANGGPTLTHALLNGSPAIDKGSAFGLTIDQRGLPRPFDDPGIPSATGGDNSDIGSYEKQTVGPTLVTVSGKVLTADGRGLRSATVTMTDSLNNVRLATTSSFGFFSFDNVMTGGTYIFRIQSRSFRYSPQSVLITAATTLPDFLGQE